MRLRPASLAAVALVVGCSPDIGVKAYNNNPEATITSHADGGSATEGVVTTLRGAVSDPDDGAEELLATWYVDGGQICAPAPPDETGLTFCDVELPAGDVEIVLEVQDSRGAAGQDAISLVVDPNEAPDATIIAPLDGQTFYADTKITFEGYVEDAEDPSTSLTAYWESDLQGDLVDVLATPDGSGTVLGFGYLDQGEHALTLRVSDTQGKTGVATATVVVGPPNTAPSCAITAPADGAQGTAGETISFAATATDPDVPNTELVVTWTSDKDGLLSTMSADSDGSVSFPFDGLSTDTHDITLEVSDEAGLGCSDSILVVVGEAPVVIVTAPASASTVNETASVSFSGTVSDDDAPSTLDLEWTSDVDGVLSTAPADGAGNAGFTLSGLTPGVHTVVLEATDSDGLTGAGSTTFTVNAVPTAPTVTVTPDPATTTDDLFASASGAVDPDGSGPISYTYTWYEDGSVSGASTSATFPAAATVKGRTYKAVVVASDGLGSGPPAEDEVDVVNTPPIVASISIDPPTGVGVTATLTCLASATDADGDVPSLSYTWEDVTTATLLGTGDSVTLTPAVANLGDEIRCTVVATDDELATATASASVVLDNVPPTLDTIAIVPGTGVTTSTALTCVATASDIDGGAPSLTYQWENLTGGGVLGTSDTLTLTPATVAPGDDVRCTATATDGGGSSDSAATSITVQNTDPVISSVIVSPSSGVTTTTTLSCSATATDADGLTPTLTYAWDNVSTGSSLATGTVVTLDPGRVNPSDEVRCTVTANDLHGGSDADAASVVVGNTTPTISSVSISPDPARAGDTLVCSWTGFTDADGDPDLSQLEWQIDGVPAGTAPTLAGGFVGGDVITCTVTPFDGYATGIALADTAVVANSAPVLADATLTPDPAHEDDLLICTPGATSDADGTGVFAYTYEWRVGGATTGATGSTLNGDWFSRGDSVGCVVTPSDGSTAGAAVASNLVSIVNTEPSIGGVTISPTPATADDLLSCGWTGFDDPDGDPDLSSVQWTVNGTLAGTSTLLSSGFGGGDLVECTVTPFDGLATGAARSASVVIGNSPPSIASAFIDPDPAYSGDTLTCGWSGFDDPDLDPDLSYAQWTIDGSTAGTGTTLIAPLVSGQVVTCTVTPFDGGTTGTPVAATVTVSNTAPVLASVSLTPDPGREDDTLTCAPGACTDVDGGSCSFAYAWAVNGGGVAPTTSTLNGDWFSKGDSVVCTVTPNDGDGDGAPVDSATVDIVNTAPTVATVTVVPDPAEKSDPLTCTWSGFNDVDGDSDLSTISWTINGASAGSGATLSSGYRGGDDVVCSVTPFDGTDVGTPVTYALTIVNNPPVMTAVSLNPVSPNTDAVLTATGAATDPDGDPLSYIYTWYVDGSPIGATGSTLDGAIWFDKHESIYVSVVPDDGVDTGAPMVSTAVDVINSAPLASVLEIDPAGPTEYLDDLVCTVASAGDDLDEDTLVHAVSWEVDGAPFAGPVSSTYEPGDTVYASDTFAGVWRCSAAPYDGEVYGPTSFAETEVSVCSDPYLVFDGVDDYVSLGYGDNLLGITNAYTVTAWVWRDADTPASTPATILDAESSRSGTNAENAGFRLWVNDNQKLKSFYGTGADPYWDSEGWTIYDVREDGWQHLAVTRTGRTVTMYYDGIQKYTWALMESEDVNWDGAGYETDHYQIGRYEIDPSSADSGLWPQDFWKGTIAHVAVWKRDLSGAEIAVAAGAGDLNASLIDGDLVGYWPMTEGTGSVVYDASGNGNDGVIVGPTWTYPCPPSWP